MRVVQDELIGPEGPKHPGNRQFYDKRGCPDAGAPLCGNHADTKVATFYAALWLTFTLPLTLGKIDRQHANLRHGWLPRVGSYETVMAHSMPSGGGIHRISSARQDVFDYIEFFYNPQRKHVRNGMLSPIAFEQQQKLKLQGL